MRAPRSLLLILALAACGGSQGTVAPAPESPTSPETAALSPVSATASAAAPASVVPVVPLTYDAEFRQILDQMVAVDTSHGNETTLLEPVAIRYKAAGVPVQILESAPGRGNLVARLKGNGTKKPLLLMAHVDVVPVEGQPWTVPPFVVTDKENFFWGRGINDDKSMAASIVALTLELARSHTPLTRDIIVALTAGEETGGAAGARWLAENHKELLDADIALNEGGGQLLANDYSKVVSVSVGVSEKTFQTFKLTVKGKGGHSSQPPTTNDPVVALSRALVKVGEHHFPGTILPETKAWFASEVGTAEPQYVAALKHAVSSAPHLLLIDNLILSKDAGYNAALRTTCVTTMLKGSPQDNVLPTTAEATINCRILPGDTRDQVRDTLTKLINDPTVELTDGPSVGDAPPTPFEGEVVDAVKKVAAAAFPGAPILPGMSSGATDSRHVRVLGIKAYGVSPVSFTRAESKAGHTAHGADERRAVKWLSPSAAYFRDVVRTLVL